LDSGFCQLQFNCFNATPKIKNSKQAAHFAKRNTKFGDGGKRGRAKIPSPQPPSFLPARAFNLTREARRSAPFKKSSDFVKQTHCKVLWKRVADSWPSAFSFTGELFIASKFVSWYNQGRRM